MGNFASIIIYLLSAIMLQSLKQILYVNPVIYKLVQFCAKIGHLP